jgi:DNA invertase Pin-like site-specific DNA recombinase
MRKTQRPEQITASAKPAGRLIGYARVSTDDQDLTLQLDKLRAAGVDDHSLYTDKVSALARKRPGLDMALKEAVAGDTVVVWKLDRFARSLIDLLTRIRELEARGVAFRSLTDNIDTSTPVGNLLLAVLGAVAQFERDLIAERTKAGMAAKKKAGVKFGPVQVFDVGVAADLFRRGYTTRQVKDHFKLRSMSSVYRYFDHQAVAMLHAEGRAMRREKRAKRRTT